MQLTQAFYSPAELAALLGLHPDTILNYIHGGKVFAIQLSARTYRIPQREVQRLIAPETIKPPRFIQSESGQELAEFDREIRDEIEAVERRHGRGATVSRR